MPPLIPRTFASTGFEVLDASSKVEEETLPTYDAKAFYPGRLGEVIGDQYQVIAKLGYGTSSTVWLSHDLQYVSCDALIAMKAPPPVADTILGKKRQIYGAENPRQLSPIQPRTRDIPALAEHRHRPQRPRKYQGS
jgi:hypothetical protein